METNHSRPSTPIDGLNHMILSPVPVEAWPTTVPAMPNDVDEFFHAFEYRGRKIEVSYLADEEATTPASENEYEVTPEQAKSWERGEWWYHNILVYVLDKDGEWLNIPRMDAGYGTQRVPGCMDHNKLIQAICDGLCNGLDAAGIPKDVA